MVLYKYVSLDGALAILRTSSLGFTRASHLNDPFDTPLAQPLPMANALEATFAGIGAWGKSLVWEKSSGILSLTRTPTNALMWAHYADQHRGVVLAIDAQTAGLLDVERNLVPAHFGNVVYARHRPSGPYHSKFGVPVTVGVTHQFVLEHYEKWQRLFLTKPIEWAYEEEVRVVKTIRGLEAGKTDIPSGSFTVVTHQGRPIHCFQISPEAVVAVYAGVRVSEAGLAELEAATASPILRVSADQGTYQIRVPAQGAAS